MQVIAIPNDVLREINSTIYRFLWERKDSKRRAYEKVKGSVMINDFEMGGIKMIDLQITQDSLLCKWLIELSDENNNAKLT